MALLIAAVIATFIVAGVYVGYHYSQDPSNFESHSLMPGTVSPYAVSEPAQMAYTCGVVGNDNQGSDLYDDSSSSGDDNNGESGDEKDGQCMYSKNGPTIPVVTADARAF